MSIESSSAVRPSNLQDSQLSSNQSLLTFSAHQRNTNFTFSSIEASPEIQMTVEEDENALRLSMARDLGSQVSHDVSKSPAPSPGVKQQNSLPAATQRRAILGSRYAESLLKYDLSRGHDQLINYFCIVGMEDADILHSIMTVKEMIHCNYQLNSYLHDDLVSNDGILTGDRAYFADPRNPRFHVPVFQPMVLSRVPSIDRTRLLFPVNLADFIYPDGVQVISASEVLKKKQSHIDKAKRNLPQSAWLDSIPFTGLDPQHQKDLGRHPSGIQRHFMLTN